MQAGDGTRTLHLRDFAVVPTERAPQTRHAPDDFEAAVLGWLAPAEPPRQGEPNTSRRGSPAHAGGGPAGGPAGSGAAGLAARAGGRRLVRLLLGRHGWTQELWPQYPLRFRVFAVFVFGLTCLWISNYLFVVSPTIQENLDSPCRYSDNQLTYNAQILFFYLLWFVCARLTLFVPCISARLVRIQVWTHGFCKAYCVHLLFRDGPLYTFVLGSLLFWFHLMQSPICAERNPKFYKNLQLYAMYSNLISMFCLILAYWHKLLADAVGASDEQGARCGAPAGTLEKLQTCHYDAEFFGDEEGTLYPAECAICLGNWETDDVIKLTPCAHAFHEECLGSWLRAARTCALCRRDLVTRAAAAEREARASEAPLATPPAAPPATWAARVPAPQLVGAALGGAGGPGLAARARLEVA